MRRPFAIVLPFLWTLLTGFAFAGNAPPNLQEGDIVFSSSPAGQGRAIMDATGSIYTHCGVVLIQDGKLMVIEAVEPVRVTPLAVFISHSEPGTFTAKRLKNPVNPASFQKAREWAVSQIGKNYDSRFLWDDERLYCSELVWKVYQKAGVALCEPRNFNDYDLEKPSVQKIIAERFGSIERVPASEKVVAPGDLAASKLLVDVS